MMQLTSVFGCSVTPNSDLVAVTETNSILLEGFIFDWSVSAVSEFDPKNTTLYALEREQLTTTEQSFCPLGPNLSSEQCTQSRTTFTRILEWIADMNELCANGLELLLTLLSAIFASYDLLLNTFPAATKSVTAGVVSLLGDMLAQVFERTMKKGQAPASFKIRRSLTVAAEGLFVSGPILHYAYDQMEESVTSLGIANVWMETVLQVFLDILVLDSLFTGTLMVTSALLQGRSKDIISELKNEYVPAVRVAWLSSLSMAPLQFLNFGLIPLRFRVLITNFQDVIWNAAVSFMAHRKRD